MYGSQAALCSENLAERLTFTSFATSPFEQYGVDEIERPYAIVALPGYQIPKYLNKQHKDALWLNNPPIKPMKVWDGFCPIALFEVIYECFGFRPFETEGKIGVVDVKTRRLIEDTRDPDILEIRPTPRLAMDEIDYRNHLADLLAWSCFFARKGPNGEVYRANGGHKTVLLYDDLYTFVNHTSSEGVQSVDTFHYHGFACQRSLYKPSSREQGFLKRGPVGLKKNVGTVARTTDWHLRNEWNMSGPTVDDVKKKPPESLYQFCLSADRDPKTGMFLGIEKEVLELAAQSQASLTAQTRGKGSAESNAIVHTLRERMSVGSLMQALKVRAESF